MTIQVSLSSNRESQLPAHPLEGTEIAFSLCQQLQDQCSALLVIDMQKDFVSETGLLARRGADRSQVRAIIPGVNRLIDVARKTGKLIIWVETTHSFQEALPNYLAVHLRNLPAQKWTHGELLVSEGGDGAQWDDDIAPRLPHEPIVTKNMYSAFRGTRLAQILGAHRIRTLVLTGCNTNVCLHSTAIDAFCEGYYPIICEDASATSDTISHETFLQTHRNFYGLTAKSDEIATLWIG